MMGCAVYRFLLSRFICLLLPNLELIQDLKHVRVPRVSSNTPACRMTGAKSAAPERGVYPMCPRGRTDALPTWHLNVFGL